jgi:hypothetical protein
MPENSSAVIRAYLARVDDVNPKERSVVGKINTGAIDRFRTTIDPKGVDLSNYNANRVVLWEHGQDPLRGAFPVGRNSWVRPAIGPDGPELIAKTIFHDKASGKGDDFCERLFECYRAGDLKGFSVRVVPKDGCSPPTSEEIRSRPELADCYMCYRSTELAEYSCVAVPGNQECLTVHEARSVLSVVSRGLTLPQTLIERANAVIRGEKKHEPIRYALMKDGQWHVIDEHGGIVSSHETREEAQLQLDQLAAEHLKTAEHGDGGDDDTRAEQRLSLPPLGGRSFEQSRAELLGQIRGLFSPEQISQAIQDTRDHMAGRV